EWIIERNLKWIEFQFENNNSEDPFSDEVIFAAENYYPPIKKLCKQLERRKIDTSRLSGGRFIKESEYYCELLKSSEPSNEYGRRLNKVTINLVDKNSTVVKTSESK